MKRLPWSTEIGDGFSCRNDKLKGTDEPRIWQVKDLVSIISHGHRTDVHVRHLLD